MFDKSYTSPFDRAHHQGKPVDVGTIGPNPTFARDPESFKNAFVDRIRFNPDSKNLYSSSTFSQEAADDSLNRIKAASQTDEPDLINKEDNPLASDFARKYLDSVLIEKDKKVTRATAGLIAQQPATAGSSAKDPNTVNQFPGQGGTQVG
jgi:hypothetical protein